MLNKNKYELSNVIKLLTEQSFLHKEVLTFKEAAIYLQISPWHLNKLATDYVITHYMPYRDKVFFHKRDLDAFLLRNKKISLYEVKKVGNYHGGNIMNRKFHKIPRVIFRLPNQKIMKFLSTVISLSFELLKIIGLILQLQHLLYFG